MNYYWGIAQMKLLLNKVVNYSQYNKPNLFLHVDYVLVVGLNYCNPKQL